MADTRSGVKVSPPAPANPEQEKEVAKRKKEQEDWVNNTTLVNEAFNHKLNYKPYGWKNKYKSDNEEDLNVPSLSSDARNRVYKSGLYGYEAEGKKADFDISLNITKDPKTGAETANTHIVGPVTAESIEGNIDFLIGTQGARIIEVSLKNTDEFKDFNKQQVEWILAAAERKQAAGIPVGLDFGLDPDSQSTTKKFIESNAFTPKERNEIINRLNAINKNQQNLQMGLNATEENALKGSDSAKLKKPEDEMDKTKLTEGAYKKEKDDPKSLDTEQQVAAIGKETERMNRELDDTAAFTKKLDNRLTAQAHFLNNPEALQAVVDNVARAYDSDEVEREKVKGDIRVKLDSLEGQLKIWAGELAENKKKLEGEKKTLEDDKKTLEGEKKTLEAAPETPDKKAKIEENQAKIDKVDGQLKKLQPLEDQMKKLDGDMKKLEDGIKANKEAYDNVETKDENVKKAKDARPDATKGRGLTPGSA